MDLTLSISILSFFLQNFIAYLKFKKFINPIFLFSVIHFFHNWSFSFSRYFNEITFWRADLSVSYDTMYDVLYINLLGSWAFFIAVIVFAKTKQYNKYYKIINTNKFLYGYYFLSLIFTFRFIASLGAGLEYGENQALDSMSSFDPISRILFFRVILCVIYILTRPFSKTQFLKILLIEVFLSTIMGERKDLVLIFLSYLIPLSINRNINILMFLRYSLASIVACSFLLFIPIYRSAGYYIDGFYEQLKETFFLINEYGAQIIFYILNLTNSEGVQNWTYQLIENGEMTLLYGKSYLQALMNMFILRPFQGNTISSWQGAYHFKDTAYPDVTNQGWDFTFTAEAIQNFGGDFAFISFVFLGLFISFLYRNRNRGDYYMVLYYFAWPILAISFRTDTTSMFRLFSYVLFVYIILYFTNNIRLITKK